MKIANRKYAQVEDIICWTHSKENIPLKGVVIKCYPNSVVVEILYYGPPLHEIFANNRTVVNHKRYNIVKPEKEVS